MDLEAEALQLATPVRLLAAPLLVLEVAQHRPVVPEDGGVGGEHHVGQARDRGRELDPNARDPT